MLLSLAPVAVLGAFLYTNTKKTLEEEAIANLSTFAAVKAAEITTYIDHLEDLGYYSSSNVDLVESLMSLSKIKYNLGSLEWVNKTKPKIEETGQDIISVTDFNVFLVVTPSGSLIYGCL